MWRISIPNLWRHIRSHCTLWTWCLCISRLSTSIKIFLLKLIFSCFLLFVFDNKTFRVLSKLSRNPICSIVFFLVVFVSWHHFEYFCRLVLSKFWWRWNNFTRKDINEFAADIRHYSSNRVLIIFWKTRIKCWLLGIIKFLVVSWWWFEFVFWIICVTLLLQLINYTRVQIVWIFSWNKMTIRMRFELKFILSFLIWKWINIMVGILSFIYHVTIKLISWLIKTLGWLLLFSNRAIFENILWIFWSRSWFYRDHRRIRLDIRSILILNIMTCFWSKGVI